MVDEDLDAVVLPDQPAVLCDRGGDVSHVVLMAGCGNEELLPIRADKDIGRHLRLALARGEGEGVEARGLLPDRVGEVGVNLGRFGPDRNRDGSARGGDGRRRGGLGARPLDVGQQLAAPLHLHARGLWHFHLAEGRQHVHCLLGHAPAVLLVFGVVPAVAELQRAADGTRAVGSRSRLRPACAVTDSRRVLQ